MGMVSSTPCYAHIQKNFERALETYDHSSVVQRHAGLALLRALRTYPLACSTVLDLGCGTGLTTQELCPNKEKKISLTLNDFSEKMLKKATLSLASFSPKSLLFNFDERWPSMLPYDLIFSNMAFQWSFNLPALFKRCFDHLKEGGFLAFSIPLRGTFDELKTSENFPFYTLEFISKSLLKNNFKFLKKEFFSCSQHFETHLEALQSLKNTGSRYHPRKSRASFVPKSVLYSPSTLTYKIGLFILLKRTI